MKVPRCLAHEFIIDDLIIFEFIITISISEFD
jgi:hypothetical protein